MSGVGRGLVRAGSLAACAIAVHTAINLSLVRRPDPRAAVVDEEVTILIPARDEATRIEATLRSVLAQSGVPLLRVVVLDDGSTDGTGEVVARIAADDSRVILLSGADEAPPPGWLGKTWACQRLADAATGTVLVFVDADVELEPEAVRSTVALLRHLDLALVAPYPRQVAVGMLERLVQPLVTWSWAATLPVRWAEHSSRPSLSAANGQFLVLDATAYRRMGGHAAVRGAVIEDVALMRALKSDDMGAATVDGSRLAHCRMYDGGGALVDGYAKSLWSAFGGPAGTIAVNVLLVTAFVVPAAALASKDPRARRWGALGYLAGTASRSMVAARTGERVVPDALLHPGSVLAFTALNVVSWWRHARGANRWKGRPVTTRAPGAPT